MARLMNMAVLPVATAALMLVAGCAQQQRPRTRPATTTKAPEPVRPAQPAPAQPAPRAAAPVTGGMAFPTGDRATSAVWVSALMPAEVRANTPFTYDINVENLTNMPLQNVILTGAGFQNLNITQSTPPYTQGGPNACGANPISWNLGDIPARTTRTIKVTATAPSTGASSNCFNVSYNNCLCVATNVVNPALELVKTTNPAETVLCDTWDYRFVVRNPGTGAATNVRIADQLPAGVTTVDGKTALDLDAGTLAAGQSKEFTVKVKAAKTGRFENNAQAKADGGLTANSQTVTNTVRQAQLRVEAGCSKEIFINRTAAFEYTVTNTGDAPCNVTLTATIPSGSTFVSATDGGTASAANVSWTFPALAPNASRKVSAVYRPTTGGTGALTSQVSATCPCANTPTASCTTNIVGIPAQLLDGVDNPDPVAIGENVTYTLQVTNQGSITLTNVKLNCVLDPATMQYVDSNGPTGKANVTGANIVFPVIPSLAPGERRQYTVIIKATAPGQVSFKAESSSDQITVPLRKDETTNFFR